MSAREVRKTTIEQRSPSPQKRRSTKITEQGNQQRSSYSRSSIESMEDINMNQPSLEYIQSDLNWELDVDISDVNINDFAFEGFDPALIKRKLTSTPGYLKSDIVTLLSVNAHIGPNTANYHRRLKPSSAAIVDKLISKYNVQNKPRTRDRETITMQRIQSAFPILAGRIAHEIGYQDGLGTLCPAAYRFPAAASIIQRNDENLKLVFREWAMIFDRKINRGMGDPEKLHNYLTVMNSSNYVSEEIRLKFATKYVPKSA